jgi:hypothetical protein
VSEAVSGCRNALITRGKILSKECQKDKEQKKNEMCQMSHLSKYKTNRFMSAAAGGGGGKQAERKNALN